MIYCIVILGIVILDQIIKFLIGSSMTVGETIPIIENIFHITYIQNTGAAFSILEGQRVFLIIIPLLVMICAAVLLFIKRKSWHTVLNMSIAFICAGGIGNLIDRAMRGYVVDMFDFRVFPVFNVADIFVCLGCGLIIYYMFFIDGKSSDK